MCERFFTYTLYLRVRAECVFLFGSGTFFFLSSSFFTCVCVCTLYVGRTTVTLLLLFLDPSSKVRAIHSARLIINKSSSPPSRTLPLLSLFPPSPPALSLTRTTHTPSSPFTLYALCDGRRRRSLPGEIFLLLLLLFLFFFLLRPVDRAIERWIWCAIAFCFMNWLPSKANHVSSGPCPQWQKGGEEIWIEMEVHFSLAEVEGEASWAEPSLFCCLHFLFAHQHENPSRVVALTHTTHSGFSLSLSLSLFELLLVFSCPKFVIMTIAVIVERRSERVCKYRWKVLVLLLSAPASSSSTLLLLFLL